MPLYPTSPIVIPDSGWTHRQVADEVQAIGTELGTKPSGTQANVGARFTVVENRLTAVEGATSLAGVEVGAAQLTADYDVKGQTQPTVFTDIGLSMAVPAQTRAYNVTFACTVALTTTASFAQPKYAAFICRIVDSGITQVADASQFPIIPPVAGAQSIFVKVILVARVAAGQAATTWKVQGRTQALDAQISALSIYAGAPMATPIGGVSRGPALLQAVTV